MQIIAKKEKEQAYGFKRLTKVGYEDEVFEEVQHKALVRFEENPRIIMRKTSIEYVQEDEKPSSTIGEFGSESLGLESIADDEDHRSFVDIRRKMRKLAEGKPKFAFENEQVNKDYSKYMEMTKKMMDDEPINSNFGSPKGRELVYLNAIFDKEDLQMAQSLSNGRFYVSKKAIATLKNKY